MRWPNLFRSFTTQFNRTEPIRFVYVAATLWRLRRRRMFTTNCTARYVTTHVNNNDYQAFFLINNLYKKKKKIKDKVSVNAEEKQPNSKGPSFEITCAENVLMAGNCIARKQQHEYCDNDNCMQWAFFRMNSSCYFFLSSFCVKH